MKSPLERAKDVAAQSLSRVGRDPNLHQHELHEIARRIAIYFKRQDKLKLRCNHVKHSPHPHIQQQPQASGFLLNPPRR